MVPHQSSVQLHVSACASSHTLLTPATILCSPHGRPTTPAQHHVQNCVLAFTTQFSCVCLLLLSAIASSIPAAVFGSPVAMVKLKCPAAVMATLSSMRTPPMSMSWSTADQLTPAACTGDHTQQNRQNSSLVSSVVTSDSRVRNSSCAAVDSGRASHCCHWINTRLSTTRYTHDSAPSALPCAKLHPVTRHAHHAARIMPHLLCILLTPCQQGWHEVHTWRQTTAAAATDTALIISAGTGMLQSRSEGQKSSHSKSSIPTQHIHPAHPPPPNACCCRAQHRCKYMHTTH